jgi:hypothetical protein
MHSLAATDYAAFCDAAHYQYDLDRDALPPLPDLDVITDITPSATWPAPRATRVDVLRAGDRISDELVEFWSSTGRNRAYCRTYLRTLVAQYRAIEAAYDAAIRATACADTVRRIAA